MNEVDQLPAALLEELPGDSRDSSGLPGAAAIFATLEISVDGEV